MFRVHVRHRVKPLLLACVAGIALASSPSAAQQVDSNKLLEVMVRKGLVTREEADAMIAEASVAAPRASIAPVPVGGVAADGTQTIPYVPQVVRDQIKQELRTELGSQAQAEGWAKPGEVPEWTKRITVSGDIRARMDAMLFDRNNYTDFVNWGAINEGGGADINPGSPGFVNLPYLNTRQNRTAMRLRARLGVAARIDDRVTAELRIATGNDRSPVSTNQTLGQVGEFGKYQLWLDRAAIHLTPVKGVGVELGRFANPFWSSTLMFDEDLNFDGISASAKLKLNDTFGVFGTAGFFPMFNTSLNFGSRDVPGGFSSRDRYLTAGQFGVDIRPTARLRTRFAGGYFRFEHVQGELSAPCAFNQDVCDTDAMRPMFQQFGNTHMALRNNIPNPAVPESLSPDVQYFGLASKFELLSLRGEVDYGLTDRLSLRLEGDYLRNLGFNRGQVAALAQNNFAPIVGGVGGQYDGGNTGWQARLSVGHLGRGLPQGDQTINKGDWNAFAGYRRLESDAMLDAFADSDFGLGGTNMKGWFAGGSYGIAHNTAFGLRWLSANEIAGPPLSVDHLMVDLTTRF
ncbi:MAG TPA: putative porin [Sphingobium sp.]|uniref:putative porin n=1 Tax=Sphingobium sp. TaxID=1912891 RepID=UPI002ED60964